MHRDQLLAILWLRWRLTRNQWSRGGELNAIITTIALAIGLVAGAAGGVGGILLGALGLAQANPTTLQRVWDGFIIGFLILWMVAIVQELQKSETIDISRLLHLPVSLREVFFLNYLASHLSLTLAVAVPFSTGLCVGLSVSHGASFLLLLPVVAGFFFMMTAWTYCLRGWLAALMVNQRKRRAIVMAVTVGFILVFQLPNLIFNFWIGRPRHAPTSGAQTPTPAARGESGDAGTVLDLAHRYIPFLWLPHSARRLGEGRVMAPLLSSVAFFGIGVWGLARAYRSTLNFYRGDAEPRTVPTSRSTDLTRARATPLLERSIPFLPEEVTAVALANLRAMARAPEVKMALAMNVLIFGILGGGILLRNPGQLHASVPTMLATAGVAVTFLGLLQVFFNQFGFDRDGFRALVLLPAPRKSILFGKNLSLLPVAAIVFAIVMSLLVFLARLSPIVVVEACLQFIAGFCLLAAAGNLVSILCPYRISPGSMKPTKTSATTTLLMLVTTMLFPVAMVPLLAPALAAWLWERLSGFPAAPVRLLLSVGLVGLSGALYWAALNPLGRLLHRREQRILETVTSEVE